MSSSGFGFTFPLCRDMVLLIFVSLLSFFRVDLRLLEDTGVGVVASIWGPTEGPAPDMAGGPLTGRRRLDGAATDDGLSNTSFVLFLVILFLGGGSLGSAVRPALSS